MTSKTTPTPVQPHDGDGKQPGFPGNTLKNRNICILLGSWGWGGAERQGLMLADGLRERYQCQVHVAALGTLGPAHERCRKLRLPTLTLPRNESRFATLTWLKTALGAERLVKTIKPEAIAAFTYPANLVAGMAARRHGIAAIWGQRDEGLFRIHPQIEKLTFAACMAAVANGPGAFEYLQELSPADPRITMIRNGIKLDPATSDRESWRERIGVPRDGQLVTMVANLTRAKDHLTLLHAWRTIENVFPKAHLACAGRLEDNADAVTATVRSLALERVHLLGQTDDVSGLYRASEIAILSSRSEGQSNAVLEAMACNLPVIASNIPGCSSLLPDGPLVPPGDAVALAEAISRLLASPDLGAQIGTRNEAVARLEFSSDRFIERYSGILRTACTNYDARRK